MGKDQICNKHGYEIMAYWEKDHDFVCDIRIQKSHQHATHKLVSIKDEIKQLKRKYYQTELELHQELELAKTVFAKKLIRSRESRVELLDMLKSVVEDIESGLTEDDVAFEKLLIAIKETDRVVNNTVLWNNILNSTDVALFKDKSSLDSSIRHLREQHDFMNKNIREFENIKVCSIADITK